MFVCMQRGEFNALLYFILKRERITRNETKVLSRHVFTIRRRNHAMHSIFSKPNKTIKWNILFSWPWPWYWCACLCILYVWRWKRNVWLVFFMFCGKSTFFINWNDIITNVWNITCICMCIEYENKYLKMCMYICLKKKV